MTLIQGRGRPRRERLFVAPSVAHSIAPFDSSLPPESGDKLSDQLIGPSGAKPLADDPATATNIAKYSEDDLQRILKAVLEARIPSPAPAPAPVITKVSQEKLKTRSPDVYLRKFHMDCYNFCK